MNVSLNQNLEIALLAGAASVRLTPTEALNLAADLARGAFRRIAVEEGAETLLDDSEDEPGTHAARQGAPTP